MGCVYVYGEGDWEQPITNTCQHIHIHIQYSPTHLCTSSTGLDLLFVPLISWVGPPTLQKKISFSKIRKYIGYTFEKILLYSEERKKRFRFSVQKKMKTRQMCLHLGKMMSNSSQPKCLPLQFLTTYSYA